MSTMRAVYTNLRAARTAIKDMGRVRDIAKVLVHHGFGHVVEAWHLQDKAILSLLMDRTTQQAPRLSGVARLSKVVQELGPTFVKLGQILSTRPDLVPPELCEEFKTLQDHVAEISYEEAKSVVESSLGKPIKDVFATFDDVPLASASIAQVYTATLKTGEEVVVKVQRPGIRQTIESDINILYWLSRQAEQTIPEAEAVDPVAITREFERAISRELNFRYEATALKRFERNFGEWETVHIPKLYDDLSSETILVMERLRGHKITEAGAQGHDMGPLAQECVRMVFKMVFEDGFFHGDLHPGNLLILNDGRIGLIDFGLVGRMNEMMKDAMAELLLRIVTRDYEGVARAMYDISIRRDRVDYDAFEQDVVDLMSVYFEHASLAEVDFSALLRDIIDGAVRNQVRVPPDFTMFFKAIMTVEGIGKIVSPDLDLISECRPYVERLVAQRYGPERVLKSLVDTLQSFGRFARQFPISANRLLAQLDEGEFRIGIHRTDLQISEEGRDRRVNRGVLAAFACVLFVCATVTRDTGGWTLFGVPSFSFLSYALGGYLGARLLWRILRSGRW